MFSIADMLFGWVCFVSLAMAISADDVIEDSFLDAMRLISKYGYPAEAHEMTTPDGYILTVHRIPGGKDAKASSSSGRERIPVFLMHGFQGASTDFLCSGPNAALAYYLADLGYDVWLGNSRGNIYSRHHAEFDMDHDKRYWNFSFHEMGIYDLPTMIDYVVADTGIPTMHYVGHSQGTGIFFVMISTMPEYNSKFRTMHALAPTPFTGNNTLYKEKELIDNVELMEALVGYVEYPSTRSQLAITAIHMIFRGGLVFQSIAEESLTGMRITKGEVDISRIPVLISHSNTGSSTKTLYHHLYGLKSGKFRRYDYGEQSNMLEYGSRDPPDYDLSKVTVPVYLYHGDQDHLATYKDVLLLNDSLPNSRGMRRVSSDVLGHLGFIWGKDARTLVYRYVDQEIKTFENTRKGVSLDTGEQDLKIKSKSFISRIRD